MEFEPIGWALLRKRDGRFRGFSHQEPTQTQLRFAHLDGDEWVLAYRAKKETMNPVPG